MEGTRIGSYRLTRKLGEGGMGAVYLAESDSLSKRKAVKVLLTELSADPAMMARFRNEAQAVAAIDHDNIIGIDEFSQLPNGQWFIMMPFLEGASLATYLASHGPLSVHTALHILAQIGAALHAAHTRGFVHRDLKPENIFITSRPSNPQLVKLLDFGIAKNTRSSPNGMQTASGMVLGTPVYMAAEQYEDAARVDARADIFSLGVLAYVMLSGEYPFGGPGENWMALYNRQRHESPAPLPWRVPARVQQLIYRALAFDPRTRPQTTQEFILEFAQGTPDDKVDPAGIEIVRRVASELLTAGPQAETTQNPHAAEPSRAPWPRLPATPAPMTAARDGTAIPVDIDAHAATAAPATADARPPRPPVNPAGPPTARAPDHEPNAYPAMSLPPLMTTLSAASGPVAAASATAPARGRRLVIGSVGIGLSAIAVVAVVLVTNRDEGEQTPQPGAMSSVSDARALTVTATGSASQPSPPPAVADAMPPPARSITVTITTIPEGADLMIDGKPHGVSPAIVERTPGAQIEIRAQRDGYRAASRSVVIDETTSSVEIRLETTSKSRVSKPRPVPPGRIPDAAPSRPGFNPDDVAGD